MKKIKNEMIKSFIFSGLGLILLLFILYKSITSFIVDQEIQKARLLAHTLVYTREYLANVAPYVEIKDQKFHPFSLTPAYAVSRIALMIQKNEKIYVKQTSDRYRNPNNKPNEYEIYAINFFKNHPDAKEFFQIHNGHKFISYEHLFYAYPLKIEKSCLKCHGPKNEISKPLLEKLEKIYGNRAFGYKLGEIRGIISIKIPFNEIKHKVDLLFMRLSFLLLFLYLLGIVLFMKINKLIFKDIKNINTYLQNNLSKNIYRPFKKKLHFYEFEIIKKEINNAVISLKTYQKKIYKSLYYNELTGLPNRKKLLSLIRKTEYPIILLDIDSFKEINYYYGEKVADEIIKKVAERLKNYRVFHIKIDEFAILKEKNITQEEIYNFTKHLIKKLEEPYIVDDYSIVIKFRAGIAFTKRTFTRALSALDATRFLNKDIAFCSEAEKIRESYQEHLIWLKKLKVAIEHQKIVPYYQPIMDKEGKICKFEALVRLIDENNEVISPYFFLEVAKKSRLYFEITKQVIEKTFDKFNNLEYEFSINLSTLDMENDYIKEFIIDKLSSFKDPKRVSFEIVESEDIKNSKNAYKFVKELKKFGCKILIDDFGSGYANFDYLLSLGADGLKIDGSLIKNILIDKNSQIIVKTIVNFAKEVNMQVIAEFVENKETYDYLKTLEVDCFQGYYFSPPKEDI
ncbi:EAL domain-containing protein [Nautilia lithotrophica]